MYIVVYLLITNMVVINVIDLDSHYHNHIYKLRYFILNRDVESSTLHIFKCYSILPNNIDTIMNVFIFTNCIKGKCIYF